MAARWCVTAILGEGRAAARSMTAEIADGRRVALVCGLLVLVGFNLRTVILGVPPVLPLIRSDLGLTYTATGLVTSLPVLVMGGLAWPAGIAAGRLGGRTTVALGLALLTAGGVLRAVWPSALALYALTAALSLGIALSQTAVPVLARQWFPSRIGFVSALFSNGLIIGESVAAGLTTQMMAGWFGRDAWRSTFVAWSVPVAATAALWLALAPASPPTVVGAPQSNGGLARARARGSAGRRVHPLHIGVLLGMGSLVFFGMNGWIATYDQAISRADMAPVALAVLNVAQLPVSLAMTAFAQRLAGRRWPFVLAGAVTLAAITGWIFTPAALQPLWAALLGGSSAFVFVLGIALPALLAGPGEVARLSGITLTLSYGVAFVGPLLGGALWDTTHLPGLAFAPIVVAGVCLIALGSLLPDRGAFGLVGGEPAPEQQAAAESDTATAGTARP